MISQLRSDQPSPLSQADPLCRQADQPHGDWQTLYGGVLRRCGRCGLVATDKVPEFDYDGGYFVGGETGGYDFDSPFSRAYDEARFNSELDRLEKEGLTGSILDIGCATGIFLHYAQQRGREIAGVEVAQYARERVSAELGVPIAGSLAELPEGESYELVTLHHVLEHIHGPLAFLRDEVVPRVGRRLLIEVPNFASLAARTHGPRWKDLRPEQHVYHYTPDSLARMVEAAGLKVRRVTSFSEPLWSVRTAVDTLRLLPTLVLSNRQESTPFEPGSAMGVQDVSDFQPARGLKKVAADLAGIAMWPILRTLENRCHAQRLVVEAEPG